MRADACVHFNGTQHKACDAGVAYESVRAGHGFRLPCLPVEGVTCATTCHRFTLPTAEQLAEHEAKIQAALDRLSQRAARRECVVCGEPVATFEQGGRCVYAKPCGHRQGQGRAADFDKHRPHPERR